MSRTQAECRHHGRHMKQKRRQYFRVFQSVATHGRNHCTPQTSCSCPMFGNQGERHGMSLQEINYHLRYADWQEDKCTMISP